MVRLLLLRQLRFSFSFNFIVRFSTSVHCFIPYFFIYLFILFFHISNVFLHPQMFLSCWAFSGKYLFAIKIGWFLISTVVPVCDDSSSQTPRSTVGCVGGRFGMAAAEFHLSQNTQRTITETVQTEHRHCCSLFLSIASLIHDTGLYSMKFGLFDIQWVCSLVTRGQR